ncbi:HK97 family phage prohead protease [Hyphomonadaceae bacterium ML37]|nr:HK97 family phage prohead protease [Hyphomonadaceae bacterium ML37]
MANGELQLGAALASRLELRREGDGSVRISGRFPYRSPAILVERGRNGGEVREVIEPGAFADAIAADSEIHFLAAHSFDKPLASKRSGTLTFRDTPDALEVEAHITPAILRASYAADAIAAAEAGLITGLSPGFRLPPDRESAESWSEAPDGARVRMIKRAMLAEMSLVTRPAYAAARASVTRQCSEAPDAGLRRTLYRWRR